MLRVDESGSIRTWKLLDASPTALNSWDRPLSDIAGKTADDIFLTSQATDLCMPVTPWRMTGVFWKSA